MIMKIHNYTRIMPEKILRTFALIFCFIFISSCNSLLFIANYSPDEQNSGKRSPERVKIYYVRPPLNDQEEIEWAGRRTDEYEGKIKPENQKFIVKVPTAVMGICSGAPKILGPETLTSAATFVPFVAAAGQITYDRINAVIDDRLKKIVQNSTHRYEASVIIDEFNLPINKDYRKNSFHGCFIIERKFEEEQASLFVFALRQISDGDNASESHSMGTLFFLEPVYAFIPYAGAETVIDNEGKSKVSATVSIGVANATFNAIADRRKVSLLADLTYQINGVEIGKNLDFTSDEFSGVGTMFFAPAHNPTIVKVSVSVIERGSAAAQELPSDREKAARTAIRSAIGTSIQKALSE